MSAKPQSPRAATSRECKKCGAGIAGQRSDARQCPACRLLQILRWCLERKRVRKCVKCGARYRSAGEYDLAYCIECAARSTSPAVAGLFRGTVARCEVCAGRGDCWWEASGESRAEGLRARIADYRVRVGRGERVEFFSGRIASLSLELEGLEGAPATPPARLALDHRVPVCASCAKHPERQGDVVGWLERSQEQRIRDNASRARDNH